VIGGEAVGGGELHLILSLFDHGPGKEVRKRLVADSELLLDKGDYRRRGVFCGTLMGISCVALILTFDETQAARGQVFDTNIRDAASTAGHGHFLSSFGNCAELSILEPDIFYSGCSGLRVQCRLLLIGIFIVDVAQILGVRHNLIEARVCAIEMRPNHIDGVYLCPCPSLLCDELPVATTSKIMLSVHLYCCYSDGRLQFCRPILGWYGSVREGIGVLKCGVAE